MRYKLEITKEEAEFIIKHLNISWRIHNLPKEEKALLRPLLDRLEELLED